MRQFYLKYQIFQSLTGKLTWTHYSELLGLANDQARGFYEKQAVNESWSVRELKRQINSSLHFDYCVASLYFLLLFDVYRATMQ